MFEGRRRAVPIVALATAAVAAMLAWKFGPADKGYGDSAFYLDGARHLAQGDGYVSAYAELAGQEACQPITHWAPGTSLMMTPWIALGVPPLTAAAIVVGACYVGSAVLIFLLGVALAGGSAWPLSALVSGLYLLQPGTRVWLDAVLSDLPWATFALLSLYLGLHVMRTAHASVGLRIAWGLSMCWLVLMRYAGLLFLPGLIAAVALGARAPIRKRALLFVPVLLTAAPGVALWNLRNKLVADKPLGGWHFVDSDLLPHLSRALGSTTAWVGEALHVAEPLGIESPLRWLIVACALSLVPLTAMSLRSRWRQLGLVVLAGAGYLAALVFTASVTLIATLGETRLWIVIWPLSWLAMLVVVCAARPRWCLPFKSVVIAALACVLGVYAYAAYRELPYARLRRGLLHQAWARAAEVLPEPVECLVLITDPRPLMLHRALPPLSPIPASMAELKAAEARTSRDFCIVTTDPTKRLRLTGSAERRRREQETVIEALKAEHRLERIRQRAGVSVYRLKREGRPQH